MPHALQNVMMNRLIFVFLLSVGFTAALDFSERCDDSIEPRNGSEFVVSGSTVNATVGTFNPGFIRCDAGDKELIDVTNQGVFFTVQGTDAVMQASACSAKEDYKNRLSVFGGCDIDSCVISTSANKDAFEYAIDCPHGNASIVEWQSTFGETYKLFVQDERATQSGDFTLGVKEMAPDNWSCENALGLTDDATVAGTTAGAEVNTAKSCPGTSDVRGVWYRIPADANAGEKRITAVACSREKLAFSVFSAGDCGNLTCVESVDYLDSSLRTCKDGSPESRVSWIDTEGKSYNLHIYSYNSTGAQFRLVYKRGDPNAGASSAWQSTFSTNLGFTILVALVLFLSPL